VGTRSNIGYINKDGSVVMSYSHWDGYPGCKGKTLLENYLDCASIKELVSLGASSSIYGKIRPNGEHTFGNPEEGVSIFYHRDRGEPWEHTAPINCTDTKQAIQEMEEYLYLWDGNTWLYSDHKSPLQELTMEICKKD